MSVKAAMKSYWDHVLNKAANQHSLLTTLWNGDVDSFIYVGVQDRDGVIQWRPLEKTSRSDFESIELEVSGSIHPSIKDYFNSYWFCDLGGTYKGHRLQLDPVLPNIELSDFRDQLVDYLRVHDNELKHVPLGMETSEDLLIVVENASGTVMIEDFERRQFKVLADSIEELLTGME